MRKNLLIIGAGNVGGFLAYNFELFNLDYTIIGLLDDAPDKIGRNIFGLEVLGPVDSIKDYPENTAVAIGIAAPHIKKKIAEKLRPLPLQYPSFISRNAWISNGVSIGKGSIIYPGVSINHETHVGDFVIMNMNCAIGHNSTISSYCSLAPGVNFAGFTFCEEAVDVGIGTSTIQNVRIGSGTIVGGQSMVVRNIPSNSKIKGVPAKVF